MPTFVFKSLVGLAVVLAAVTVSVSAEEPIVARVLQHRATNGQPFSAVFLKASHVPKGVVAHQHIILVDTSASQVGEHRQQSLDVLEALLKALPEGDEVRLFAADLQAEPLVEKFSGPRSTEVTEGIDLLKLRVPLGATNMEGVLRTAMQAASDLPTDITYIGDGMSTADLLELAEMRSLVSDLRRRRLPVHGFGVGGKRNMQLLGTLGQQTGGFVGFDTVIIDASEEKVVKANKTKSAKLAEDIGRVRRGAAERAVEQGKTFAAAMVTPVFFSTELQVTPSDVPFLPAESLPIRTDRDTIYVTRGALSAGTRIMMKDAAGESLEWKLAAPLDQPGATFLPAMVGQLEAVRGFTNPLAGMPLFLLAQSDFSEYMTAMAQSGGQALQLDDLSQAQKIADMVAEAEPNNEAGIILRRTIEQLKSRAAKPAPGASSGTKPVLSPIPTKRP